MTEQSSSGSRVAGLLEPRARLLIEQAVSTLGLSLQGLTVLTEMGSNNFVFTPSIAAAAGADRVYALVKDSPHGSAESIASRGRSLLESWRFDTRVHIVGQLLPSHYEAADIVMNVGLLRPIDRAVVERLRPGAVVPYMYEAWEYRHGDVDLDACRRENIPVMGTREDVPGFDVFSFCGPLAAKMLLEAHVEIQDCTIGVLTNDKMGRVVADYLRQCGARVRVAGKHDTALGDGRLDALVVCCILEDGIVVGDGGWLSPQELAAHHPGCVLIQYAGANDTEHLARCGIQCYPDGQLRPRRMARTLADLGPKPVIRLNAAGLKVAELMWRKMREIGDGAEVERILSETEPLCQRLTVSG